MKLAFAVLKLALLYSCVPLRLDRCRSIAFRTPTKNRVIG